ncbi:MAG: HD domain-containing protein [bacterium]|nr:HD domain-containing protein [bacterium]
MIKVSAISIEKLRNGQFQNELPEFFELKSFIENNGWHNNDSVFNHTLAVLAELEKLLSDINDKINSYLNENIDTHTRKELLFLGTLFHDIAKSDVLVKNGDSTSCPKHEEIGSEKVKSILDRFDLSDREKAIVVNIVKHHGEIHVILDPNNDKIDEQFNKFKSERHDIFMELILLAMADTLGSQLKDNDPNNFKFRIEFYKRIIDNY